MPHQIGPPNQIGAEARGKLRLFKKLLAKRCVRIDAAMKDREFRRIGGELAYRNTERGRLRALAKLSRALGPGAKLESPPGERCAVWVYLRPRGYVIETNGKIPGMAQNCITANYVVVGSPLGKTPRVADGLWTLEATDHALGRLLQRARTADPETVLLEAHRTILKGEIDDMDAAIRRNGGGDSFLLAAGPGAFICTPVIAPETTSGLITMHIRLPTWLPSDLMYDHQVPIATTADGVNSLGGSFLKPVPLQSTAHKQAMKAAVAAVIEKLKTPTSKETES
jgi:hypothetical protein